MQIYPVSSNNQSFMPEKNGLVALVWKLWI